MNKLAHIPEEELFVTARDDECEPPQSPSERLLDEMAIALAVQDAARETEEEQYPDDVHYATATADPPGGRSTMHQGTRHQGRSQ